MQPDGLQARRRGGEGEVAERLHGDDDLDRAVIGLPDGERQLLPGRLGIVTLEHAQLAALTGGADAIDAAQRLDVCVASSVMVVVAGTSSVTPVSSVPVGVKDGDRETGDDFTLEVEGALATLGGGLQEHGVGGVAGSLGDRQRDAALLDDGLRCRVHGRRHDPVGEGHDEAQVLLPEHACP